MKQSFVSAGVLSLVLASSTVVGAQTPGVAIPDAFKSLIGQGCWDSLRVAPLSIPRFAGVRFYRGTCRGEHGDQLSATVGIDSDSVLYLLASSADFNFLADRHPADSLRDSAAVIAYAQLMLELSGELGPGARIIRWWEDLPKAARDSAQTFSTKPMYMRHDARGWTLRVFTTAPGVYGPYAAGWDLGFDAVGREAWSGRGWTWQRAAGP